MLKDNKFSFTANTEGFEEGLEYAAGLYKDELIDPAAFTQNEQQMAAIGNNQDIEIGGAATCGHLAMFVDINNEARAKDYENILPLTGSNGYRRHSVFEEYERLGRCVRNHRQMPASGPRDSGR